MIRVHIICEGQTEEMFVNEVLAESFAVQGVYLIPSLIGKPGHKGGNFRFERLLTDVRVRLLGDARCLMRGWKDLGNWQHNLKRRILCAPLR